jgi:hypothetical protein
MKLRHKHIKSGLHTLPDSSSSYVPEGQRKSNFTQVVIKYIYIWSTIHGYMRQSRGSAHIHTHVRAHAHTNGRTTRTQTHMHAHTNTHTLKHSRARTHAHTHTHTNFIGSTITALPPSGFLAKILYAGSRDQNQSSLMLQQSVRVDVKSGLNGWSRW